MINVLLSKIPTSQYLIQNKDICIHLQTMRVTCGKVREINLNCRINKSITIYDRL